MILTLYYNTEDIDLIKTAFQLTDLSNQDKQLCTALWNAGLKNYLTAPLTINGAETWRAQGDGDCRSIALSVPSVTSGQQFKDLLARAFAKHPEIVHLGAWIKDLRATRGWSIG